MGNSHILSKSWIENVTDSCCAQPLSHFINEDKEEGTTTRDTKFNQECKDKITIQIFDEKELSIPSHSKEKTISSMSDDYDDYNHRKHHHHHKKSSLIPPATTLTAANSAPPFNKFSTSADEKYYHKKHHNAHNKKIKSLSPAAPLNISRSAPPGNTSCTSDADLTDFENDSEFKTDIEHDRDREESISYSHSTSNSVSSSSMISPTNKRRPRTHSCPRPRGITVINDNRSAMNDDDVPIFIPNKPTTRQRQNSVPLNDDNKGIKLINAKSANPLLNHHHLRKKKVHKKYKRRGNVTEFDPNFNIDHHYNSHGDIYTDSDENEYECVSIKKCVAIQRIILALEWYSRSGNEHEKVYKKMNHRNFGQNLMNDYNHILEHHLNAQKNKKNVKSYNKICKLVKKHVGVCTFENCNGYRRYLRSKGRTGHSQSHTPRTSTQNEIKIFINVMDSIHCCFMHLTKKNLKK